ncbi:vancomycin high temperature exclusion protein [Streptomyces polyrhachis]|uniref:Vancomycin high temperature exclusion protein n=1 Tax=Streptomyces polyrhachis TaxID=1282885 RepID=A0ABW2GID5_9ACTN
MRALLVRTRAAARRAAAPARRAAARPQLPRTVRGRRRLLRAAVLACALALLPPAWVHASTSARVHTVATAPPAPVALVLGAGLWDGEPSPYLAHRLDAAVELYRLGRVRAILVSGDNSTRDYDEPTAMRDYLTARGVPRARIVRDHAGFDTWDSCTRAARVFGVSRALVVTQRFHVPRALALCRAAGIDAHGVAVEEPRNLTWHYGGLREIPGAAKATLDTLLRPDPHFLGPREQGVHEALRR